MIYKKLIYITNNGEKCHLVDLKYTNSAIYFLMHLDAYLKRTKNIKIYK